MLADGFANVALVNLLVAMFADTYNRVATTSEPMAQVLALRRMESTVSMVSVDELEE